jgi:hypothetical protein
MVYVSTTFDRSLTDLYYEHDTFFGITTYFQFVTGNKKQYNQLLKGCKTSITSQEKPLYSLPIMELHKNRTWKDKTPSIAAGREKRNMRLEDRFSNHPPLSERADYRTTMQHRLKTNVSENLYAARKSTVEPVFGIECSTRNPVETRS